MNEAELEDLRRRAFALSAEGRTYAKVAERFQSSGEPNPFGGDKWTRADVEHLMSGAAPEDREQIEMPDTGGALDSAPLGTAPQIEEHTCPSCGEEVRLNILRCPHCRYSFRARSKKAITGLSLVVFAILSAISGVGMQQQGIDPNENFFFVTAPIVLLVGIVLGHMARGDLKLNRTWRGRKTALATLICGYGVVALVATVAAVTALPTESSDASDDDEQSSYTGYDDSGYSDTSTPPADKVADCSDFSFEGDPVDSGGTYFDVSVRNMACGHVGRLLVAWSRTTSDLDPVGGYRCSTSEQRSRLVSYRCASERAAFRFSFVPQ